MIVFEDISLKNFLSFGNVKQTLKLDDKSFHLIVGKNLDKEADSENSNGVGKSSIFQAIHYALYGKSIGNKITLPTLVNNINKKNMEVVLHFTKDDVKYTIERGRNPTYLHFYKNGEEIIDESLGDSRDTQDLITKVIGMNEDLFCQTVLLSCQVPIFMEQSTANQKLLIEKILGVDVITEKIQALKEKIKDTKNDINNESFKVNTLKTQQETNKKTFEKALADLDDAEKNWKDGIETRKKEYQSFIEKYKDINFDKEKDIIKQYKEYNDAINYNLEKKKLVDGYIASAVDISNQIKSLTAKKEQLKQIDIETEKKKFDEIDTIKQQEMDYIKQKSNYDSFMNTKKSLEREYKNLCEQKEIKQKQLDNVKENICPTCGQTMDAEKVKAYKDGIQKEIDELEDKAHKVNIDIMETVSEAGTFEEKTFEYPKTLYKSREELLSIESQVKECDIKIESFMGQLNKIVLDKESVQYMPENKPTETLTYQSESELERIKADLDNAQKQLEELNKETNNPYNSQRETLIKSMKDNEIEINEAPLSELLNTQEHNELLLKLLNSPSSYIRKAILDKSLDFLNSKIRMYLSKLGSLHIVKFNNDMSIDITSNGLEFGTVSSGEMGRITIALTLAFREVWENLNNNSTNLLMIDEILDRAGLDEPGMQMCVKCIKDTIKKNILMVSHNPTIKANEQKIITVVKENSFSTIVK